MINFNRPTTSPATRQQRVHIARLMSIVSLCGRGAGTQLFITTGATFLEHYDQGRATQNQYADALTLYRDIRWEVSGNG